MTRKTTKRISTTIILCLLMTALFSGCASEATTSPKEEVKAPIEDVAETKVEETTKEVEGEPIKEETTQMVEGPQTVGQWSETLDRSEPKLTIWNDISKEGIVLENGQKYVLREGDLLVICTKEKGSGLSIDADISLEDFKIRKSDKYVRIELYKDFLAETLFEIKITVAGVEYPFSVTLISENATAAIDDSESSTEMSAMEWTTTLEYEEPKLVAWNDETGTREVIENGGQYKMQEGDTLAVYYPEGYVVYFVTPYEFVETLNFVAIDLIVLEYKLPAESQNINLKVEFCDSADVDSAFNYVITTP